MSNENTIKNENAPSTSASPQQNSHTHQTTPQQPNTNEWNEPRLVVFLIGIVLMLEGIFIYIQVGFDQLIVASVTAVAGISLILFAWLIPLEEEPLIEEKSQIDETQPQLTPSVTPSSLTEPPSQSASELQSAPTTSPLPISSSSAAEVSTETNTTASATTLSVTADSLSLSAAASSSTAQVAISSQQAQQPHQPSEELVSNITSPTTAEPLSQETPQLLTKETAEVVPALSWLERLRLGLKKTRDSFVGKLKHLVFGKTKIDQDLLDELEAILFEADIGVKTTQELLAYLQKEVETRENKDPELVYSLLKEHLRQRLNRFSVALNMNPNGLTIFLVIGVNGVGKTTTIAKLAHHFIKQGQKVTLAAGDTFRAAAIDQLSIWGQRVGAEVIKGQEGGDPGALVFDAIHAARKRQADILIVDTAGRMHVKVNLMDELKKVRKIIEKESNGGPHEILLVLDATTGQNAIQQAKLFHEALPVTGIIMTKLDGTAKGGVLFAVEEQISAPVKFIGVGEKVDDLMIFDPEKFLEALFEDDSGKTKESDYKVLH